MNDVGEFLSHYGVKGMKWGRRKAEAAAAERANQSEDHKRVSDAKAKPVSHLSNKDLQVAIERMRLETQYAELSAKTTTKSAGQKFATKLLGDIGKNEFERVAKGSASLAVEKELAKRGQEDLANRIKPKKK